MAGRWRSDRSGVLASGPCLRAGGGTPRKQQGLVRLMEIFTATKDGNEDRVKHCIARNVNVDGYKDDDGVTALILASFNGETAIVKLLLQAEADMETRAKFNSTALMYASDNGHIAILQLLLKSGANKVAKTEYGVTALILASERGHATAAHILLNARADKEAATDTGHAALILAAENGHTATVKLLLEAGAEK